MILEEITLNNFRIYKGNQTILLGPKSKDKPIVLIGGLNGGGKTTLLDAFQLVLYGKLATCSKRGKSSYRDFLKECINDSSPLEEGASISLTFKHFHEGEELKYTIERLWNYEKGINEKFNVWVNNNHDKLLSDHWLDYIDGFIPVNISHLFFFDGEKIEDFADEDQAKGLLYTAINSLLGGRVVDRLETDLLILEKRKNAELLHKKDRAAINKIYADIKVSEAEKRKLYGMRAKIKTQLESKKKQFRAEKLAFQVKGGDFYYQREELNKEKEALKTELEQFHKSILSFAAGVLPFRLVNDLYVSAKEQGDHEYQCRSQHIADDIIANRLKVLKKTSKKMLDDKVWDFIHSAMLTDNKLSESCNTYLNIDSEQTRQKLISLQDAIDHKLGPAWGCVTDAELRQAKLLDVERALENIPNESVITKSVSKIEAIEKEMAKLAHKLVLIEHDYNKEESRFDMLKTKILNILERQADEIIKSQSNQRIIEYSNKARATLKVYKERLISKYIDIISKHILECFSLLIRKKSLISNISISADGYEIILYGHDDVIISPNSLSAGERQLFAISTLWGLAKASGRPLPVIIDTPLGRLDSSHRTHLLNNYFPNASHQVILLSTDEEIDKNYYDMLESSISHSYTLEYDQKQRSAKVKNGYIF